MRGGTGYTMRNGFGGGGGGGGFTNQGFAGGGFGAGGGGGGGARFFAGGGQYTPSYDSYNGSGGPGRRAAGPQSYGQQDGYGGGWGGGSYGGSGDRRAGEPGSKLRPVDWRRFGGTNTIQKNFYHEHAAVQRRDQGEVDMWLTENECTLTGHDIPRPILEFNESTYPEAIRLLLGVNYSKPTAIQSISWPVAMSGRDMISIARTGSGKTLGFILPAIVHVINQPKRSQGEGPTVLVLLPTRELAIQVEEVTKEYCKVMNLTANCCYGGAPKGPQSQQLKRGVDICIATPGRLLDFLEADSTNMRRCSYLVLDEADRMLDMGFEPQIRKIVSQIQPSRQTLMFSATWPKEVRTLAAEFMQDPLHLTVGSLDIAASHNIQQHVEVIEEYGKPNRLLQLLDHIMRQRECKTLIFVETKRKADELTRQMRKDGWPALCIHGDKNQSEREWVLSEFKEGKTPILLATDVAARGLDVSDIKFVINYDYPNNSEDYVHRIGRTGRRDKTGTSYTFFTPHNAPKAADLIKVLTEAKQIVPDRLTQLSSGSFGRYGGGRGGGRGRGNGFAKGDGGSPPKRGRYGDTSGGGNSWGGGGGDSGGFGGRW